MSGTYVDVDFVLFMILLKLMINMALNYIGKEIIYRQRHH